MNYSNGLCCRAAKFNEKFGVRLNGLGWSDPQLCKTAFHPTQLQLKNFPAILHTAHI